jgi:hypothetical protein
VQQGDLVRLYDDQTPQTIKEHIVNYLTLDDVNYTNDTLSGKADPGQIIHAWIYDPNTSMNPSLEVFADTSGNWLVDFSGIYDLTYGSDVIVQTRDNDGDSTRIDMLIDLLTVMIDIKPGSYPNCFNIDGKGVVPVAILGSAELDVMTIDTSTLNFAGMAVLVRGKKGPMCHYEDVSGDFTNPEGAPDGYTDLVCQFEDNPEYWESDASTAEITGLFNDGVPFYGIDEICITQEILE